MKMNTMKLLNLAFVAIACIGEVDAATNATLAAKANSTKVASAKAAKASSSNSTKVASAKATKVSSAKATKAASAKSTKVSSAKATKLASSKSTKVSSAKATKASSSNSTKVSSAKATKVSSAKVSKVASSKSTKVSSTKAAKAPSSKSSKYVAPPVKPSTSTTVMAAPTSGRSGDSRSGAKPLSGGGVGGDPHFRTIHGTMFSYHGQCDLVMAQSHTFASGLGLEVHARTEIVDDWSLVSNAAVRIGSDIFELSNDGTHYFNGIPNIKMPVIMGGQFLLTKRSIGHGIGKWKIIDHDSAHNLRKVYTIHLDSGESITITQNMQMISIKVDTHVEDTIGMLGSHMMEGFIGRDGTTILDNPNMMGDEWQVTNAEPMLFHEIRSPQYPEKCQLPSVTSRRRQRKLRQSNERMRMAEEACVEVIGPMHPFCVEDVLLTGNVNYAEGYADIF